ncbi:MAG: methionyl-tRNA formyltransferase [Thermoanaerobaculia bacterium]|nr:methionyl-tRNA formyltransferase [Thermoanaerobaculia bacterium]
MPPAPRIVFFGTPDFALPSLRALCEAGWEPVLVVSQPARPGGRGRELRQPPVAAWARSRDLEVAQPEEVRDPDFLRRMDALEPDLAVVVAFGQIFGEALLSLPGRGCVNVHASLLPRWRGAAPIQAAIRAGDRETGITTLRMDEGLDTGPILRQHATPLWGRETAGALFARLSHLGAAVLVETIDGLRVGSVEAKEQDHQAATHAPRLSKEDGRLRWDREAEEVFAHLRAMIPWPGAFADLRGQRLQIHWGEPEPEARSEAGIAPGDATPGTILGLEEDRILVACGRGAFGLTEVQLPGRRRISARDLWNGKRLEVGERLE